MTRKWQDQNGQDRYTTEVVLQGYNAALTMLEKAGAGGPPPADPGSYGDQPPGPDSNTRQDLDDDIPF